MRQMIQMCLRSDRHRMFACPAVASWVLGLLVLSLAGCDGGAAGPPEKPVAAKAPAQAAGPEATLLRIDKVGYQALASHESGKVLLVDFWGTWCEPCRERFPHVVELDRKYASRGLVVVSIACDDEKNTDQVLSFLKEQGATFRNLRSVGGAGESTFSDFEISDGALPHYKLYDRKGKLRQTFSLAEKEFTPEEVAAAVLDLLDEKDAKPSGAPESENDDEPTDQPDENEGA